MEKDKSKFGFWSIVLLTINGIIGTGIFLSPAGVVKTAGTMTPIVYLFAAVFASILAITFASAAKYVTKNGSSFAYAKAAFGNDLGFYVGITRFAAGAIAWGVMATAVVRTTLGIFGGEAAVNNRNITIGFLILMAILLAIILSGTKITRLVNNLSTLGKITALVVAIGAGLVIFLMGTNNFSQIPNLKDPSGAPMIKPMDLTIFVGSMLSAFYAFTGFESVATAASEMEDPAKNLPRAIPLAIAIIAFIYIGVVTVAMAINPQGLLFSKEPVVLASAFNNPIIKKIIVYGAVVSMFGINVAAAFSTPRIFDAMADEGMVPSFISKKNAKGVPLFAFLITAIMAIFVPMAFQYDMKGIMIISSVSRFIQFVVVPIAVLRFYKGKSTEPILNPPKGVFTDVIIPILAFIASVFLLIKFDWVGQFSMTNDQGATVANTYAIVAMIVGYIVLPLLLYIPYRMGKYEKKENSINQ